MEGHAPLPDPDFDSITRTLADGVFKAPLNQRNEFANSLLAWAESLGEPDFSKWRDMVFQTEMAIHAKDWVRRFPEEDGELATTKLWGLLVFMTREMHGRKVDGSSYEQYYGPDIPIIVDKAYQALLEAKLNPKS